MTDAGAADAQHLAQLCALPAPESCPAPHGAIPGRLGSGRLPSPTCSLSTAPTSCRAAGAAFPQPCCDWSCRGEEGGMVRK